MTGDLILTIEQAPLVRQRTIELERNPKRGAWSATLTLRAMQLSIAVPRHHKHPQHYQIMDFNFARLLMDSEHSCTIRNIQSSERS